MNIHTKKGIVKGVFGWPAIHVRDHAKEAPPKLDNIFIDIGAKDKKEVEKMGVHVGCVITYPDSFHILKLTEVLKTEIKPKSQVEEELLNELIDAEALALMEDDFLELESLVLEGVNLYELNDLVESNLEITGLQTIDDLQINNFSSIAASELFNIEIIPNKIEIFEGENSYAFIMMTDRVQPTVQPYIDVTELALEETRIEKANIFLNEFDSMAQKVILGEEMLPEVKGISMENYKSVKRFSSLLPSEVVNRIFESKPQSIIAHESINGCLLYTSPSPRDVEESRMPSSA